MAFDAFLKLDGIKGEGAGGAITLESFSWGVSNTSSLATGGAGAGKAVYQDFSFTSRLGSEAPDLFLATVEGKRIRSGQLTVSDKEPVLVITFSDLIISSYKLDEGRLNYKLGELGDGSVRPAPLGAPVASVSFNFAKFIIQTHGNVASGGTDGTIG
jgi:type VI protein secretion system component Hcp